MIRKLLNKKNIARNVKFYSLQKFIWILFITSNFGNAQENLTSPLAIVEAVIPNVNATTGGSNSFLGPYANTARTYQMLIAGSQLTNLVGKNIISLSFRNPNSSTSAWPTTDATFNNYDIYLSGCVNPADRSFTFANNIVGTQTQVRSGSLVIPANSVTFGGAPNTFSYNVDFTIPWNYAGGNLLIEIRHDGFSGTSRSVDGIGTSSPGYGTLVSACWESGNTATVTTKQGNFCIVNLRADDALGNLSFENSNIKVYPNPANDVITVSAKDRINKISIYNMIGQLVMEENSNSNEVSLSISNLSFGTYLLQASTDLGIKTQKIVKK